MRKRIPWNKKDKIKKSCLVCQKSFEVFESVSKIGKGKYCSRECDNSQRKGKACFGGKMLERVKCLKCDNTFYAKMHRNGKRKAFCSTSCVGLSKIGTIPSIKGKTFQEFYGLDKSILIREKIKKNTPVRVGKEHPRWVEDRSLIEFFDKRSSTEYQFWNNSVRVRDLHKCKMQNKDCDGRLEVHHILDWKNYPELRYEVNNGIVLCVHHHPHKRSEEKRLSLFFKELIFNNNL